jgi:hypothetical protein
MSSLYCFETLDLDNNNRALNELPFVQVDLKDLTEFFSECSLSGVDTLRRPESFGLTHVTLLVDRYVNAPPDRMRLSFQRYEEYCIDQITDAIAANDEERIDTILIVQKMEPWFLLPGYTDTEITKVEKSVLQAMLDTWGIPKRTDNPFTVDESFYERDELFNGKEDRTGSVYSQAKAAAFDLGAVFIPKPPPLPTNIIDLTREEIDLTKAKFQASLDKFFNLKRPALPMKKRFALERDPKCRKTGQT